jgi:hypothetical protein
MKILHTLQFPQKADGEKSILSWLSFSKNNFRILLFAHELIFEGEEEEVKGFYFKML